ncbi:phosphodiester glycosidase family protein [Streptomyces gobiensis]|nr:phosphodiester glycosidase family protein [Streptomyces gobiensis]UGY94982.1 phosphodiester glycosidase family protein [Streptomyces gobiensis]
MELARTTRPVAPGARLTSFHRLQPGKWLRAHALSVDLDGGTRVDYLSSGRVSERKTVTELARDHDPGPQRRTVAALNADFFDINGTGAPLGPGVRHGEVSHSPAEGRSRAAGIGPDRAGRILDLYFEGTLTLPAGAEPLGAYNAAAVPENGIGIYNARWGVADRAQTVVGADHVTEVTVHNGTVTALAEEPGQGEIPAGTTVLLGRDTGAKTLAQLTVGDTVTWEYAPRTGDGGQVPRTAVGGNRLLVVDGEPLDAGPDDTAHPRTAVGFSRDGATLHTLTVDGRQAASGGATLTELGRMMADLGAHNALNLDGGGSATLLAREPGSTTPRLENSPSEGEERAVPNGLALTAENGSGALTGFWVTTAADPRHSPTVDPMPGGHPERVFPGLTRELTAAGYDETYGPADGTPRWRAQRPRVGRVDAGGTFHARNPGTTEVTAARGPAEGSTELTVLGALDRIAPSQERVGLADREAVAGFGFTGFDTEGHSAPIEPADVRLDYDRSLFTISPDEAAGGFTVTARTGQEFIAGKITATVAGKTTTLVVTVGLVERRMADFEDAGRWTFSAARADGSLAPEPDGRHGTALKMTYDFSRSTATRAAYASPPGRLAVPDQPQSFGLWLKGDGKGAWPSLHLKDATGASQVLRAPYIDGEGWEEVTFEVPPGLAYPLTVHRFYIAETRPDQQYRGEIVIDELTARIPPDAELPTAPQVRDPLISTAADTAGRDWRFAVVSDAQFVAREPDSELVRQARRTLRAAKAARPDFVLINGDWVDEGSDGDLAFAHAMLKAELGQLPWYYVPGNHEVMGGSIDRFRKEFGDTQLTFDHKGTRFITLDTSSLTIRGGGFAQFTEVRRQLDRAAKDRRIGSVVLVAHVPPRDPTARPASQLTDRMEAALLERWLAGFRRDSGKGAAFIGAHVGVFDASRVDGVPYLVNGDAGKAPAAAPGEGGFTGWSLVGVDRDGERDWISVQTHPHVDALTMDVPDRVEAGGSAPAGATVTQGSGANARQVPVAWPASADWSGSPGMCVGAPHRAPRHCAAVFTPATGTVTGLRTGRVTLAVTVSGERVQRDITITGGR